MEVFNSFEVFNSSEVLDSFDLASTVKEKLSSQEMTEDVFIEELLKSSKQDAKNIDTSEIIQQKSDIQETIKQHSFNY